MSIFTEMYDLRRFATVHEYKEFLSKLSLAIEKGWIEEIPVSIKRQVPRDERWFREKSSGEVYLLESLEGKPAYWRPVEPEELFPSTPITVVSHMQN
jgi:hypothetical protein